MVLQLVGSDALARLMAAAQRQREEKAARQPRTAPKASTAAGPGD